jgi:hypothetical protein
LKKNADQQDYLKRKLEAQKSVLQQTTQLRKQAGEVVYKEERSYYSLVKKLEDAKAEYGENSKQARLLTTAVEEQEKRVAEATKTYNDFVDKEKDAKIAIGETTQQLKEQKNAAPTKLVRQIFCCSIPYNNITYFFKDLVTTQMFLRIKFLYRKRYTEHFLD